MNHATQTGSLAEAAAQLLDGNETFAEALGLANTSMQSLYALAYDSYHQGDYEVALGAFEVLCLYDHQQSHYWYGLGYCRKALQDYAGAATALAYGTMCEDEVEPENYLGLAVCFLALDDEASVKKCLEEVERTAPWLKEKADAMLST